MRFWKWMLWAVVLLVTLSALASCGCEHIYEESITVRPVCLSEGEKSFTCLLCGDTYTEVLAATGHRYFEEVVAPTCTTEGYTKHNCVCGDSYTDTVVAATGHTYTEAVTAATCAAGGYTTFTCSVCEYSYVGAETEKDPNTHIFGSAVVPLTDEQAAANPDAIGVAVPVCTVCGAEGASADRQAALIHLDFDGDVDLDSYVGSQAYRKLVASGKMTTDEQKKAVAMLDAQKNLDVRAGGPGVTLAEDGKVVTVGEMAAFTNTLSLATVTCAIPSYTISFDITVNAIPEATEKWKEYTAFFSIHSNVSFSNNRPIKLALSGVDLDSDPDDDIHTYELYAQSIFGGDSNKSLSSATGYYMTLGKEYSFRLEVSSSKDTDDTYTVFVKEAGEAVYTKLGTYKFKPDTKTPYVTFLCFSYFSDNCGNVIDNLLITAPLAH